MKKLPKNGFFQPKLSFVASIPELRRRRRWRPGSHGSGSATAQFCSPVDGFRQHQFVPGCELGPGGELCSLGVKFTPSFTPRGEHPVLFRRMEGRTEIFTPPGDNFTPRGLIHPWGTTSPLGSKFDPRGEVKNGPQFVSRCELGPGGELCTLGGMFTPLFTSILGWTLSNVKNGGANRGSSPLGGQLQPWG
jgi:hypothetical protein